jgi:tetratricopeptide (TPR) repeat protein
MSLLMEALKKAEEAKRLASENLPPGAATTPAPPLELLPAAPPPTSPLPELALHIDSVDADLSAVSTETPLRRKVTPNTAAASENSRQEAVERDAVRNVFAAKQTPKARTGLWLMLGLGSLVALTIGGYFWWQLQAVSSGSLARAAPPPPNLPPSQPPAALPAQPALLAANEAPAATTAAELPPPSPPPAPAQLSAAEPARLFERASRTPKASLPSRPRAYNPALQLNKDQPKPGSLLDRAYDNLQAGRFEEAQQDYENVLRADNKNIDALLGMATLSAQQGQSERAQGFYMLALEVDPKDATAQAGLINSRARTNPALSESRLKTSLAAQPESPALHFALGNLYASQSRWSEAQQAYFKAYSVDAANADYLFNLAVSLDHLHQNKLSAQYYQMALNAASNSRSISFDRAQVGRRILELQP